MSLLKKSEKNLFWGQLIFCGYIFAPPAHLHTFVMFSTVLLLVHPSVRDFITNLHFSAFSTQREYDYIDTSRVI
jgi:hypothetical protein